MQAGKDTFLVVDDDEAFVGVLGTALRRRGYLVREAHQGAEALAAAAELRPSHAVVDLRLGEESGLRLIPPLLSVRADMKIVVLTGYGNIPSAVSALKAGAHNYVAKPLDVDALLLAFRDDPAQAKAAENGTHQRMSLKKLEWEHIQQVLDENGGNISATARALGMHRRTLQRKLQKRPVKR